MSKRKVSAPRVEENSVKSYSYILGEQFNFDGRANLIVLMKTSIESATSNTDVRVARSILL